MKYPIHTETIEHCNITVQIKYFHDSDHGYYGHIHTTGGDVRTWGSYSGARRFARSYSPF